MTDDAAAIESVLGGFVPVSDDHPKAQETFESVKEFIAARAPERRRGVDELVARLEQVCNEIDRLRAEVNELRDDHV